ncbi:MAG: twin-arginine translocation pathway signal protein [Methylobacterium sp.]|nr:twin-arginine translocation pathway signal protein [Methylobacterium sp.]
MLTGALALAVSLVSLPAWSIDTARINADAVKSLQALYKAEPKAAELGEKAKGILVFPKIMRAGLIIGGEGGEGALLKGGKAVSHYSQGGLSIGLQAGGQEFGYAMFFMDDEALKVLDKLDGWSVGVGPTVVVMDKGAARNLDTKTVQSGVYAFIFGQQGLMAGVALKGNKITKIK